MSLSFIGSVCDRLIVWSLVRLTVMLEGLGEVDGDELDLVIKIEAVSRQAFLSSCAVF